MLRHLMRSNEIEVASGGLTPIQWSALQYFSLANRLSRTVSGFAAYNATSKGTASQIVKGLVSKGFVRRLPAEDDGRSAEIVLTGEGLAKLEAFPATALPQAIEDLDPADRDALERTLGLLSGMLHRHSPRTRVGTCHDCACLETCEGGREGRYHCRLLAREVNRQELGRLCVVHEPAGADTGR